MEEHKEYLEMMFEKAKEKLFAHGQVPMTYFILTGEDHLMVIALPDQILEVSGGALPTKSIAKIASEANAKLVIFLAEAWMVVLDESEVTEKEHVVNGNWTDRAYKALGNRTPANHPEKRECLTLMAMDRLGNTMGINGEIHIAQGHPYVSDWEWLPVIEDGERNLTMIEKWEV